MHDRDWRSGIAEAIKVALIKDADFYHYLKMHAHELAERDMPVMKEVIYRCAKMHLEHISGGDPFEMGSSRPLDFGHWAAHKLEALNNYEIRHGEAVAVGICLDTIYSFLSGLLKEDEMEDILNLMSSMSFQLYFPEMTEKIDDPQNPKSLLSGLKDFQEHLGGKLTVMLLKKIGRGIEVNHIDHDLVKEAVNILKQHAQNVQKNKTIEFH